LEKKKEKNMSTILGQIFCRRQLEKERFLLVHMYRIARGIERAFALWMPFVNVIAGKNKYV
jgi:hypothetical protein